MFLGEMADSIAGARKIKDNSSTPCSTTVKYKGLEGVSKGHGSQPERDPKGQSWNNLIKKINDGAQDYSPKYKINTHEFIDENKRQIL